MESSHSEPPDDQTPFTGEDNTCISKTDGKGRLHAKLRKFCDKLKTDRPYRRKCSLTMNLISSFFIYGWVCGQIGPSFLDLQILTGVSIDRGSAFFTASGVGFMTGSLLNGFIYDRLKDKVIIVFLAIVGLGTVFATIPWVTVYEVMVLMFLIFGTSAGILEASGNVLLTRTWGSNGRMLLQTIHFGFAFGGIISPLATAPFLAPDIQPITDHNTSHMIDYSNHSTVVTNASQENITYTSRYSYTKSQSRLYIPYSISASMAFFCALPMFLMICQTRNEKKDLEMTEEKQETADENETERRPFGGSKRTEMLIILLLLSMFTSYGCVEDSFVSFLSVFCVRQFNWSKIAAAQITSAIWIAFAVGRLTGIGLVVLLSPVTLLFLHATVLIICLLGMLFSSLYAFYLGVWIFASGTGFTMSVIYPSLYILAEMFLPLTGRLGSLFLVGCCLMMAINPFILGEMMGNFTDMWFLYLLSGEATLFYILLLIAIYVSKSTVRYSGDISIDVKDETLSVTDC